MTNCRHEWYTNIHIAALITLYRAHQYYLPLMWATELFWLWRDNLTVAERKDFIATYNMGQEL